MTPHRILAPLESRWLAEIVRRHEERHGALEDAAALATAREAPPDLEARILRRADVLGAREGWRDAVVRWHGRTRFALLVAAVIASVAGFGAAAGVLGDGSRPVNVVWALAGLLGVHLASLLLWLLGLFASRGGAGSLHPGGVVGRLWLRLVAALDRSPAAADLPLALGALLGRGRIAAWGIGAVSHALWALALAGAALGVLLLLATRRYGFVWETTILPAQAFIALTSALGQLPALLGFPVPDAATVAASGDATMLEEGGRRAWAGWLLGCLLLYGVLPRLLLALACALAWRRGVRRIALDLSRPGYVRLRARLLPDSERLGVRDPEPAMMPRPGRRGVHPDLGTGAALVALELGDDLPWPPAGMQRPGAEADEAGVDEAEADEAGADEAGADEAGADEAGADGAEADGAEAGERAAGRGSASRALIDGGRLDSREQRRAVLERLAAHPPRRLLIAVDPRQTPDRGSLGLIAELADRAVDSRVWALSGPHGAADSDRLGLWRDGLARLGFTAEVLVTDAESARGWLEEGR